MTKGFILAIVVFAIFLPGSISPAASSLSIESCAVLPFDGGRDTDMEHNIALLTEHYSHSLSQRRGFSVKPFRQTTRELRNNGFRPDDYESALAAAIAAGGILRVTHVIRGRVDYTDDSYTLETTLVDVRRAEGVRGARSSLRGSLKKFIALAPESNIAVLLGSQQVAAASPGISRIEARARGPERPAGGLVRNSGRVPARTTPPEEETNGGYQPRIRPFRSWKISWNGWRERFDDRTAGPEQHENRFLAFLEDRLELGSRINTFSLDTASGSFIGTINGLEEDQTRTPVLFFDWFFTPFLGIDLTWDKVAATTRTFTHAASDGSVEMEGHVISLVGRYPFDVDMRNRSMTVSPYAGIGLAFMSARFNAAGWWHYGFATPEAYDQWVASGSPADPDNEYTRTMSVTDDTGVALSFGCAFEVWNDLSVDLCLRTIGADTDAIFVRSYSNGNSETTYGRFPMSHKIYSLGVRYSF